MTNPGAELLLTSGPYDVFVAEGPSIPRLLYEIGRLREISFRAVGEGTGDPIDLDWFDAHYLHLVVHNREKDEVVGAYRIGQTDRILPRFGADGLYTSTLFEYRAPFLARMTPGLELGRAFVRPEYQKTTAGLALLWKGIGRFIARHPRYRRLFGAASISADYSADSQRWIVEYLTEHHTLASFAPFVSPRNAVTWTSPPRDCATDLEKLSRRVLEREEGRRDVPVLLKQYLKIGGRVLGFNRDASFGNCIDALIVVDLLECPPGVLARYVGEDGAVALDDVHHGPRPRSVSILEPALGA